jgi:spore maturation protein CgeB
MPEKCKGSRVARNIASRDRPRILVSFPFEEEGGAWHIPLGGSSARAFEDFGFEVHRFNPVELQVEFAGRKTLERLFVLASRLLLLSKQESKRLLPWNAERRRWQRLVQAVDEFQPDVLFVISTFTYPKQTLERLRILGVRRLIGWCVEGPTWIRSPADEAKLYDAYFCIHRHSIPPDSRIGWLPAIAYDPEHYYPMDPRPEKRHEVTFVGRPKPRREEYLRGLLDYALNIFGPGWDRCGDAFHPHIKGAMIIGEPLNRLYNETKVVLNISSWENEGQDCPNLRIADVPATGSFLLSDYSEYAADLFKPGEEMEFFSSAEELRDKVSYYLSHDIARERIARAGFERARQLETVSGKMNRILSAAGLDDARELGVITGLASG